MEVNLDDTPALEPPEGVIPNFDNPPSIHHVHNAVAIAALTVSAIAVTARSYARAMVLKKFDLNDGALLVSLAIMSAYVSLTITTGNYGQGIHQWNVPLSRFLYLLKIMNFIEILYAPLMFLAKYVVLRQIESIFLQHRFHSFSHRGLVILIWANLLFYAGWMFSFILACIPRSKIWDPTLDGQCINVDAALISSSAINILSDITILILPLIAIRSLQIARKAKIKVTIIFAVGSFAIVASIVRFVYTIQLSKNEDITYTIEPFAYWTEIEYATVVLVACFPVFPLLFRHIMQQSKQLLSSGDKTTAWVRVSESHGDNKHNDHSSVINLREHAGHELDDSNRVAAP